MTTASNGGLPTHLLTSHGSERKSALTAMPSSPLQPSVRRKQTGGKSRIPSEPTTWQGQQDRARPLKMERAPKCSLCQFRRPPKLRRPGHMRQGSRQLPLLPLSTQRLTIHCHQRLWRTIKLSNRLYLPRSLCRVRLRPPRPLPRQRAPTRLSPAQHRSRSTGCSLTAGRCSLAT